MTVPALAVLVGGCNLVLGLEPATLDTVAAGGGTATSSTGGPGGSSSSSSGEGGGPDKCIPGKTQCAGNTAQTCDGNGQWKDEAACQSYCSAGACVDTPSCAALGATCGPKSNESCCASPMVVGGTYNRSNDPSFPATVSDFRLDRFEITVGRFRAFVDAYPGNKPLVGAGAHPKIPGSGWDSAWNKELPVDATELRSAVSVPGYGTWTDVAGANENLPLTYLNWYTAFAFCAWDGARLPTEAEWNYAEAGGVEERKYAWGAAAPDTTHAVYGCVADGSAADDCSPSDILNVGSKSTTGDGKWGQADLIGSLLEWNLDWYTTDYSPCPAGEDCALVTQASATERVNRGGDFTASGASLLCSTRGHVPPTNSATVGARCARAP